MNRIRGLKRDRDHRIFDAQLQKKVTQGGLTLQSLQRPTQLRLERRQPDRSGRQPWMIDGEGPGQGNREPLTRIDVDGCDSTNPIHGRIHGETSDPTRAQPAPIGRTKTLFQGTAEPGQQDRVPPRQLGVLDVKRDALDATRLTTAVSDLQRRGVHRDPDQCQGVG